MTAGISGKESGLVRRVFRILEQDRSPLVLLENVPFMLKLGHGRALDVIVQALERLGYRWAYRIVDSRAFGLPQRRHRVFLLAALDEDPRCILFADDTGGPPPARASKGVACGFYWTEGLRGLGWAVDAVPSLKRGSALGIPSPPAIVLPSGEIVTPEIRDAERIQGFPVDWTKPAEEVKGSNFRWTLVGNAVTVDVARWLGARLARPGRYDPVKDEPLMEDRSWPSAAYNVGKGRYIADISAWPKRRHGKSLEQFLRFPPKPLSMKATSGFYARTQASSLKFPPGFCSAILAHLKRMRGGVADQHS
jgi:DNA (cytosine-5)-methyltransferase 1